MTKAVVDPIAATGVTVADDRTVIERYRKDKRPQDESAGT